MLLISQDYFYPLFRNEVAGIAVENPSANSGDIRDQGSIPGLGRSPGGGMATHPWFLPGELHGQRSLAATAHRSAKSRTQLITAVKVTANTRRARVDAGSLSSVQVLMAQEVRGARLESAHSPSSFEGRGS